MLRHHAHILGGDMCGAFSPPAYARRKQRFASRMDHPKLNFPPAEKIRAVNQRAFEAHMLIEMARMSVADGLVMQLHAGAFRDFPGASS